MDRVLDVQSTAYAILSHRWEGGEDEEVTFQDLKGWKHLAKRGWKKLRSCCKAALKDGWEYVVSWF